MKKTLLLTTALTAFAACAATTTDASKPHDKDCKAMHHHHDRMLRLGGVFDGQALYNFKGNNNTTKLNALRASQSQRHIMFDSDMSLYARGMGKTEGGLEYGVQAGIRTNSLTSQRMSKVYRDNTYGWVQTHDMGKVEFGTNYSAADVMRIGADTYAAATGGINGDYYKVTSLNDPVVQQYFTDNTTSPWQVLDNAQQFMNNSFTNVVTPTTAAGSTNASLLLSETQHEKSRKITYFSPKMNGFQIGLSYIPELNAYYPTTPAAGTVPVTGAGFVANGGTKDAFAGGINWKGDVKDVNVKVAAVFAYANNAAILSGGATTTAATAVNAQYKTKAADLGARIRWKHWTFSGSYGYMGKTGYLQQVGVIAVNPAKGSYITAGVGCTMDKLYTSLSTMFSQKNRNKATVLSLGADYRLAPGLKPYAEFTWLQLKQSRKGGEAVVPVPTTAVTAASQKLRGMAFILGTKISF